MPEDAQVSFLDAVMSQADDALRQDNPDQPISDATQEGPQPSAPAPPAPKPSTPIDAILKKKADAPPSSAAPEDASEEAAREKEVTELTQGLSEKAADKFRAIHRRAWDAERKSKRVGDLEKQLQEAKSTETPEQLKELKDQLAKYDEIIRKTALVQHPDFHRQYEEPVERAIKSAVSVLGKENEAQIRSVLLMGDTPTRAAELDKLFESLSAYKATRLTSIIAEIDKVQYDKEQALAEWRETETKFRESEQAKQYSWTRHTKEILARAASDVLMEATDPTRGVEVFQTVDGQDDWNKSVMQMKTEVQRIVNTDLNPHDIAEMAMQSVAARKYRDLFLEAYKENETLKAQLGKLQASTPRMGVPSQEQGGEIKTQESFIDAIDRAAREAGLVR